MKIQSIKGVKDILPGEVEKWRWVEITAHNVFSRYGFGEIRIPIFEYTNLFTRGIGETTDIVEKEMYTFKDRNGDKITLRPEGTASTVRSYIENKMYNPPGLVKLYYIGPMFRYERPQAGRFRQFYQIGVEAMDSAEPSLDAELIGMVMDFLGRLGLKGLELQLNTLGCSKCRSAYRKILKGAIYDHLNGLCKNCQERYERNPLRVLDCKVEHDQIVAQGLPKTADHICDACKNHFKDVIKFLESAKIPYILNPNLVRGLDYYNRTAFEIISAGLGAQNAVCGGGRYDTLVEEFGGPSTPCFGFAIGFERLISLIPPEKTDGLLQNPDIFVVSLGGAARTESFKIIQKLRREGIAAERTSEEGSMKSQMRKANKAECRFVLIIGENEIESGEYVLKSMKDGSQSNISIGSAITEIKNLLYTNTT